MLKLGKPTFLLILIMPLYSAAQSPFSGSSYLMHLANNPSLTGIEGDGTLKVSYINLYPGNNLNLHSVYLSYDSYFPVIHGGAGFYLSDNYLGGIQNDIRGGLSYSYLLQAGKDFFVTAGLSANIFHRGYNFGTAVLPDMINPLAGAINPSAEILTNTGKSIFDISSGFSFIKENIFGGFSINHLAEPSLSDSGLESEKIKRELFIHFSGELIIGKGKNTSIQPTTYLDISDGCYNAGIGASIEKSMLSVNSVIMRDSGRNVNIQTGFAVKSGKFVVFYNYRFNIVSGNNLLPFSLLHQTGLAISLNGVDKKNIIKTIKFPKL
jgi:type IX secretion system PorP/SprF family membrane protein